MVGIQPISLPKTKKQGLMQRWGELKRLMDSQNSKYSKYGQTSDFLPVPLNHRNDLKWSKSSDPMYGGSNELYVRNQNFPLFSNIKLHLKTDIDKSLDLEKFSKRNDSDFSLSLAKYAHMGKWAYGHM